MIKLLVDVQDENGRWKKVSIPSNDIDPVKSLDWVISDCEPYIPSVCESDVFQLNDAIKCINNGSPNMTSELLSVIIDATGEDITSKKFVERIVDNDFLFEDITDYGVFAQDESEVAAQFVARKLSVPFDSSVTKEEFLVVCKKELSEYIDWRTIWSQYESMGFRVEESYDCNNERSIYLIHWK